MHEIKPANNMFIKEPTAIATDFPLMSSAQKLACRLVSNFQSYDLTWALIWETHISKTIYIPVSDTYQ
ncbi:unnamed protein product [Gongylonema pulchrum]|uniref:Uncharacterized protein n=1 Tax=Gongylonema pulchrum TaxID=637853 RepID=A0A183CYJ2_9BILA|nr:unnamed protein product [Gongylonema pulchrum]